MTSKTNTTPVSAQQPPSFPSTEMGASLGLLDCVERIRTATSSLLRTVFSPAQTFQEFAESISAPFDAFPDDDAFSEPISKEQFEILLEAKIASWPTPSNIPLESDIVELDEQDNPLPNSTLEAGTPLSDNATRAMAVVATLSPFIASNWDPELPPLQKSIMDVLSIAYLQFSSMDEADLQGSSPEELAWIAASKFTASLAGIPSDYCPAFPWEENTSSNIDSQSFPISPKELEASHPLQNQATGSSWPNLAGKVIKVAFLCGSALLVSNFVGGLGAAAAVTGSTALNLYGNHSGTINPFNESTAPYLPGMNTSNLGAETFTDPASSLFNWTPLLLASSAIPGMYTAARHLWNRDFRACAGTLVQTGISTGLQYYMGTATPWAFALSLAGPPLINLGRKIYSGDLSPKDAISLDTVKIGVGMAGLGLPLEPAIRMTAAPALGIINYVSELGWVKSGIDQVKTLIPNWADRHALVEAFQSWSGPHIETFKQQIPMFATLWDYAAGAIENGFAIAGESPYLTTAILIIGVILLAQGVGIISGPVAIGSASAKEIVLYEKKGSHTCKNGVTYENIKVPGPKGLNAQQQEDLFNAFIQEMLEKSPLDTRPGDTIEFRMPNEKEWVAELKPAKENEKFYASQPNLLTKKIQLESSSRQFKNYQLLHKLMVEGATATHVVESLRSLATEKIPFHIASVNPVGFKNGSPTLCAALKFLLSNPKMLEKMETSQHLELRKIATQYRRIMHLQENEELIDLTELEKAIHPNPLRRLIRWPVNLDDGKPHGVIDYETVILHLMKESGDTFDGVFEKKILIPNGTNPIATFNAANHEYPKFDLFLGAGGSTDLQELLDRSRTDGTKEILFEEKPEFLRIHLDRMLAPAEEPKIPLKLELDKAYIQPMARSNNLADPEYHLHSFSSPSAQGEAVYEATVESIMGRDQILYWKIVQQGGSSKRISIEKTEFAEAAKTASDFVYSAKLPVLAIRHDAQYNPQLAQLTFTPPAAPPRPEKNYEIVLEHGNIAQQSMFQEAADRIPANLRLAVQEALRDADKANESIVILPVPGESQATKGPIGIMWFAVQEYLRTHPDTTITHVKFQIPRESPNQDALVQQLSDAEKLTQGMFDQFDVFENAWRKRVEGLRGKFKRFIGF